MVDMSLTPADRKEKQILIEEMPPEYPWGLHVRLEDRELKLLGFETLPAVGDVLPIKAMAKVTSVSQDDREGGEVSRSVSLTLIEMDVIDGKASEGVSERRSRVLYDNE